jgi:hypothetical protein
MRETPLVSAETRPDDYDECLSKSMAVHRELNQVARGSAAEDPEDDESWRQMSNEVDGLVANRVALLAKTGATDSIEGVFPLLSQRRRSEEDTRERSVHALVDMMAGGVAGSGQRHPTVAQAEAGELSAAEWRAFVEARASLVERLGFSRPVEPRVRRRRLAIRSDLLVFHRGDLVFQLRHFPDTSEFGLGGTSRISRLTVHRGKTILASYDRRWRVACEDPATQREIDRVAAALG